MTRQTGLKASGEDKAHPLLVVQAYMESRTGGRFEESLSIESLFGDRQPTYRAGPALNTQHCPSTFSLRQR